MAVNQTIIAAAGQRYTPVKIDYSGYIEGVKSIAAGLVEKKKNFDKKYDAVGTTYSSQLKYIDDIGVKEELKKLRKEAYASLEDTKGFNIFGKKHRDGKALYQKKINQMELLSSQYIRGEKLEASIIKANDPNKRTISNGMSAAEQAWWDDIRDNGFTYKFQDGNLLVLGYNSETGEEEYMPFDKIPKRFLSREDSNKIAATFTRNLDNDDINFFIDYDGAREEYEAGGSLESEKTKYDTLMNKNIEATMSVLVVDGEITNAFKSFAVDQKFRTPDGTGTISFAQYYMANSDLYGEVADVMVDTDYPPDGVVDMTVGEFAQQFAAMNEDADRENIEKQIQIIFMDIIENGGDNNITEDMEQFLTYLYKRPIN